MTAQIELERGRQSYASRSWTDAYESLSRAAVEADDLERLATAAYMLGRHDDHAAALQRAHLRHLEAGATLRAARCAFWIGMLLTVAGATGRASGWLARAQRLVDREGVECVERGYLLLPWPRSAR